MQVKPLGNRILVKTVAKEQVSASGIILPDTAEKKTGLYEVVALGDGPEVTALGLQAGSKIFAGKYSGDEVEMDGEQDHEYKILYVGHDKDESDVIAVVGE